MVGALFVLLTQDRGLGEPKGGCGDQNKRELEAEIRRLGDALEESNVLRETLEGQLRDQINETELLRKRLESEHQLRLQKLEESKRAAERQVIGKRNALGGLILKICAAS